MWRRGIHNYIPIFLRRRGFNPLSLSPELWLDASYGTYQSAGGSAATADTDPVGEWQDRSGNGNHIAQATADNKPVLKLAIINGKPVVRFDGSNDNLTAAIFSNIANASIVAVAQFTATPNGGNLWDGASGTRNQFGIRGGVWEVFAGTLLNGPAPDTNPHVFEGHYNGGSSIIAVDGAETTGNAGAEALTGFAVGNAPAGGEPAAVDVAELFVFPSLLAADELASLRAYLNSKYGL